LGRGTPPPHEGVPSLGELVHKIWIRAGLEKALGALSGHCKELRHVRNGAYRQSTVFTEAV